MPVPGRLAQLGERQLDKLEVTGSSPVTPIRKVSVLCLWGTRQRTVFLFFSNNLGCGTSLLISAVVTVILLLLFGVIEIG